MLRLMMAVLIGIVLGVMLLTAPAFAADPLEGVCSQPGAQGTDASVCTGRTVNNPVNTTLSNVIQLIIMATAFASVITIMIAGFRYITSSGNPETTNSAKNAILFAVLGLVIALAGQLLVSYVLRSL